MRVPAKKNSSDQEGVFQQSPEMQERPLVLAPQYSQHHDVRAQNLNLIFHVCTGY